MGSAIHVLMEGVPEGVNPVKIRYSIEATKFHIEHTTFERELKK